MFSMERSKLYLDFLVPIFSIFKKYVFVLFFLAVFFLCGVSDVGMVLLTALVNQTLKKIFKKKSNIYIHVSFDRLVYQIKCLK